MEPPEIIGIRRAISRATKRSSDFDLHPDIVLDKNRVLKPAGVLLALEQHEAGLQLILTKRSTALKHHPGQIAFPGGRQDPGDKDVVAAALREAEEEIGLPRDRVEILGSLPAHETVTRYLVTPTIGLIHGAFQERPEAREVSEVFRVPLSHVVAFANFRIEGRRWRGQRREYYTIPYGPYYIWGATARMLKTLADRMNQ